MGRPHFAESQCARISVTTVWLNNAVWFKFQLPQYINCVQLQKVETSLPALHKSPRK